MLTAAVTFQDAAAALVLGLALAGNEQLFGQLWVTAPLVILVALLGLTGAVMIPLERDLAAQSGGGDGALVTATKARVDRVVLIGVALVLVATQFMVAKLGGTGPDQDASAAASRNAVANVSTPPGA